MSLESLYTENTQNSLTLYNNKNRKSELQEKKWNYKKKSEIDAYEENPSI